MKNMRVIDVVLPLSQDILLSPSVELHCPLTHAIELMARHNLQQIVVMSMGCPIGMVRLKDALQKVGLQKNVIPTGK